MPEMPKFLSSLYGEPYGAPKKNRTPPKDINLPDDNAGKKLGTMKLGSQTIDVIGGKWMDPRRIEHRDRKMEQAMREEEVDVQRNRGWKTGNLKPSKRTGGGITPRRGQ